MEQDRVAPLVGIVAAVVVLALLVLPYLLVEQAEAIGTYYETGAITPLLAGLFALLAIVVFAAGREERTDPAMAAGVTLVLGLFCVVVAAIWALTVPIDVVTGMGTNELIGYHRWALLAVTFAVPIAAAWYARSMRLI